ncbi:MAG: SLC13 family permease [Planctomycetota bacterium]
MLGDPTLAWLPPGLEPYVAGILILGMIGALASGRFGSDIVLMGALTGFVVFGMLKPDAAVEGFASPGLITIALLYVVSTGMRQTGATNMVTARLVGRPKTLFGTQLRLTGPVACVSAFVNNTPIVAMFMPVLNGIAKKGGFSPSKLFIPLSYASILGGVCTLIGTSTNIVVAQALVNEDTRTAAGDAVRFSMFTLSPIGIPILIAGLIYILVFGRVLLPDRRQLPAAANNGERREYTASMIVQDGAPIVGKSVEQAGLRSLPGLFLSRIDRKDRTIVAVGPDERLRTGDVLGFVGDLESMMDLNQIRGLEPAGTKDRASGRARAQLMEAVVSPSSRLVGLTVRDGGIRTRYGAVVMAVHRRGQRLRGKIGDIKLRDGDTLLLETEAGFADKHRDSRDFVLVTERAASAAPRHDRAWVALLILAGLIMALGTGTLEPLPATLIAAGAMLIGRCCTGPQARAGVDWQVLVTIGAAFGIGRAMTETGLAADLATSLVRLVAALGVDGMLRTYALLAAVYGLTIVFTAVMTNNAAAVLMFPIAMLVAEQQGVPPMSMAVVVAVAASCEFSTPIGYQTNLMVMGPGGYRWLDYTRFGGPLTILVGMICVLLAPVLYGR